MADQMQVWKAWLDAVENNRTRELTEWEEDFIASIKRKLARNFSLSDAQADTLERIYAEKTA